MVTLASEKFVDNLQEYPTFVFKFKLGVIVVDDVGFRDGHLNIYRGGGGQENHMSLWRRSKERLETTPKHSIVL